MDTPAMHPVFAQLQAAIEEVDSALRPLLLFSEDKLLLPALEDKEVSSIDQAKTTVTASYALHSLYYVILRCRGVPTAGHQVQEELKRVQKYFAKLKEAQEKLSAGARGTGGRTDQRTLKVDKEASKRFIVSALSKDQTFVATETEANESSETCKRREEGRRETAKEEQAQTQEQVQEREKKQSPARKANHEGKQTAGKKRELSEVQSDEGSANGDSSSTATASHDENEGGKSNVHDERQSRQAKAPQGKRTPQRKKGKKRR